MVNLYLSPTFLTRDRRVVLGFFSRRFAGSTRHALHRARALRGSATSDFMTVSLGWAWRPWKERELSAAGQAPSTARNRSRNSSTSRRERRRKTGPIPTSRPAARPRAAGVGSFPDPAAGISHSHQGLTLEQTPPSSLAPCLRSSPAARAGPSPATALEDGWQHPLGHRPATGRLGRSLGQPRPQAIRLPPSPRGARTPSTSGRASPAGARGRHHRGLRPVRDQNFEAFLDGKPLYRFGEPGRGEVETGGRSTSCRWAPGPRECSRSGVLDRQPRLFAARWSARARSSKPHPGARLGPAVLRGLARAAGSRAWSPRLRRIHRERRLLWLGR